MKNFASDISKAKNLGSARSGVSHWIWQRLEVIQRVWSWWRRHRANGTRERKRRRIESRVKKQQNKLIGWFAKMENSIVPYLMAQANLIVGHLVRPAHTCDLNTMDP